VNLLYSSEALADLVRLRDFISEHNPQAASRIAKDLVKRITCLEEFPEMGVGVAEAPDPDTLRDLIVGRYVVRYALHAETIFILRIWHGYEDRGRGA